MSRDNARSMRSIGIVLGVLLLLGACAPGPATQPSATAVQVTNLQTTGPSWDQIVAAAKKEGKVSVFGPSGTPPIASLVDGFKAKYPEIDVEFSQPGATELAPKVLTERQAGRYLEDLVVHGAVATFPLLVPSNSLQPIQPLLVGPDVQDVSKWRGGKLSYADDDGKYILFMSSYVGVAFAINKTLASASDFKSWKDLLDPKWKGKIVIYDPRAAGGAGQSLIQILNNTPGLGKDFVTQLLTKQGVTYLRDDRQILDGLSRGQFAIAMGQGDSQTRDLISRGVPIQQISMGDLREQATLRSGIGSLAVLDKAPHPNALKVYLNYLLSKEGQTNWVKSSGNASLRTDVPSGTVAKELLPKDNTEYLLIDKQMYKIGKLAQESDDLIKALIP